MNIKIGKVIVSSLSGVNVTSISPLVAPEGTKMPHIVYTRTSLDSSDSKDLPRGLDGVQTASFDIDIWHDKYDALLDIAQIVIDKLDKKRGTIANVAVQSIAVTGASESFDGSAFCQTLSVQIKY